MFGNLMNNMEVNELVRQRLIDITPYNEDSLRAVHYPLRPSVVFKKQLDGSVRLKQNFADTPSPYSVEPNEYVIIEVHERIKLPKGIVGKFVPSSNLIESGFGLTAGRIEYPYGSNGEPIRFGLKNLLDQPNEVTSQMRLAYVEFFDLRGLRNMEYKLTEREMRIFASRLRYAKDDGVDYGDGS